MSLREKLQDKREQTEAEKAEAARKEAEQLKAEQEKKLADESANLKEQITALQDKKTALESDLHDLKESYTAAEGSLSNFKSEKENIEDIYTEFKDELIEQGISNKEELIQSSEYAEDEEVKKFKASGSDLRDKSKSVAESKKSLKEEIPDLDFRGGKLEGENESPREKSIKKIEETIDEIQTQIEALKEQDPEKIAEAQKAVDCLAELKEMDGLPLLPKGALANMQSFDYQQLIPTKMPTEVYLEKFGEDALKKALFEGLSGDVERIIKEQKGEFEKKYGYFDESGTREKVENLLRKKIELDVSREKFRLFEGEQEKEFGKLEYLESQALFDKKIKPIAKRELPEVVRLKLNYQPYANEEVYIYQPYQRMATEKKQALEVSYRSGKNPVLEKMKKDLEDTTNHYKNLRIAHDKMTQEKPIFFGKSKHEAELEEINTKISKAKAELEAEKKEVNEYEEQNSKRSTDNLFEVSRLISELSFKGLDVKNIKAKNLGELLGTLESMLTEIANKELTPAQEEVLKKYSEMKYSLERMQDGYKNSKRF